MENGKWCVGFSRDGLCFLSEIDEINHEIFSVLTNTKEPDAHVLYCGEDVPDKHCYHCYDKAGRSL